jgi:hypothetical protein
MKNRTENKMIKVYECMVRRMKNAGLGFKKHRLDNECSEKIKMCIKNAGMTHELVPPNCHRCNIAEQAIQTFKNHFVLILSGVDDRFPLSLWCHLVRPAELTVNLLRQSNVTPKSVSLCACTWAAQLHDVAICSAGMRRNSSC